MSTGRGLRSVSRGLISPASLNLPEILARGYALDSEENAIGVTCVGTWIFNGLGDVAAAISVTGPSNRMTADAISHVAIDVIAAANEIAAAIGSGERPDNRDSRRRQ